MKIKGRIFLLLSIAVFVAALLWQFSTSIVVELIGAILVGLCTVTALRIFVMGNRSQTGQEGSWDFDDSIYAQYSVVTSLELRKAGFKSVTYRGQAGRFISKTVKIRQMPNANAHLVDGVKMIGDMLATTEITPEGRVQLFVDGAYHVNGLHPFESEEAQALLRDAIAAGVDGL